MAQSINLDITFCQASKCPKELKKTCGRCLLRVNEYMAATELETLWKPISIADFSKDLLPGTKECPMFMTDRFSK